MALITKKGINMLGFRNKQEFQERIEYYRYYPTELLSVESKATAWDTICDCLTELTQGSLWLQNGNTGMEAACNTIRKLAGKE